MLRADLWANISRALGSGISTMVGMFCVERRLLWRSEGKWALWVFTPLKMSFVPDLRRNSNFESKSLNS